MEHNGSPFFTEKTFRFIKNEITDDTLSTTKVLLRQSSNPDPTGFLRPFFLLTSRDRRDRERRKESKSNGTSRTLVIRR